MEYNYCNGNNLKDVLIFFKNKMFKLFLNKMMEIVMSN